MLTGVRAIDNAMARAMRYTGSAMDSPSPQAPDPITSQAVAVVELVVNLDDVAGEQVGSVCQSMLDLGALDVWTTAIMMKKQRPGVMLSVLARPDDANRLARAIIEATGSFGVRMRPWDRLVLDREITTVQTRFGPVRIKVGMLDGGPITAKPEHDDVASLAKKTGQAIGEVTRAAQAAVDQWLQAWHVAFDDDSEPAS